MEFGGRRLRRASQFGMLRIAIASLPRVFICIGAPGRIFTGVHDRAS